MSSGKKKQKKEEEVIQPRPNSRTCCSNCGRDVLEERYLVCTNCVEFICCLECYSIGAERDGHLVGHIMAVVDPEPRPVYQEDWTSNEEVLLLSALRAYGLGNWTKIAEFIGTKTPSEVETHYIKLYIQSPTAPLPLDEVQPPLEIPPPPPFDTNARDSHPSEGTTSRDAVTPAEISGWQPFRHQFEKEFNDDAENLVLNININQEQATPEKFSEVVKLLETYNQQLVERQERTAVIEDWGYQYKPLKSKNGEDVNPPLLNAKTEEDREIDSKLIPLARYMGVSEISKLADLLHRRVELVQRIETRRSWKANGIQNVHQGHFFSMMESYIRDGKVMQECVSKWNHGVRDYTDTFGKKYAPEMELLAPGEVEICKSLGIHAQIYISYKDLLLREFAARGRLTRADVRSFCQDSSDIAMEVYDFMAGRGWISG